MKEISLHLLDVARNSIAAGAGRIDVVLEENEKHLCRLCVTDDGCGMDPELLARAADPFTTTRTTRKVGMGLPLLSMMAEQTGGRLELESRVGAGTTVTAWYWADHIDCPPAGDLPGTVALLIQGAPEVEWTYRHSVPKGTVTLDTRELRRVLGPEVALSEPEVALWIRDHLREQEEGIKE